MGAFYINFFGGSMTKIIEIFRINSVRKITQQQLIRPTFSFNQALSQRNAILSKLFFVPRIPIWALPLNPATPLGDSHPQTYCQLASLSL